MFSKALFKQSCKANRLMWVIVTGAVCFMLSSVMLISGGGNIARIKNAVENTIIKSAIDAEVSRRSLNYYSITDTALTEFDGYFLDECLRSGGDTTEAYKSAVTRLKAYAGKLAADAGYAEDSDEAKEIAGVIFYSLNPGGMYDAFYVSAGETPPEYAFDTLGTEGRASYISSYAGNTAAVFLAANMSSSESADKLVEKLADYGVTREIYDTYGYTYDALKTASYTTILEYSARYEYETGKLDTADTGYAEKLAAVKAELTREFSNNFLSSLPDEVSAALEEIGSIDLYNMIVGSIFYKMAGLLLPIIYIIMVSNSLIAGQVDSGSMAYVLSTSVKRRQVTFTQASFLVLSIAAMTACMTAASMISLAVVNNPDISMTFGKLALMNLGAFCVLFAISGICFMTSACYNRSKRAMAIGGGVSMFFLVATMLGLFGSPVLPSVVRLSALNYFNYVTIISLFDVMSIADGTLAFMWKFAVLIVIGVVSYVIGSERFARKDLPL